MGLKIEFNKTLRIILENIVKADSAREKKHWKMVAIRYIDFLLEKRR